MKILVITEKIEPNDGWGRYSLDFVNGLVREGHDVSVICSKKYVESKIEQLAVLGPITEYILNPFKCYSSAKEINKIVIGFKPDVVHSFIEPYGYLLPFIRCGCPKFVTVHGTYAFIPNLFDNLIKRTVSYPLTLSMFHSVDKIIAVSEFTRDYLSNNFRRIFGGAFGRKIVVVHNGIDMRHFSTEDVSKKSASEDKKILFVGGIKPRKGLLEAIDSLGVYKKKYSDNFVFDIVGGYTEKDLYIEKLRNKIEELGLSKNVFLRGRVSEDDLREFYKNADLFLMLSVNNGRDFEGFGLVYLEANSFGLPCIGPNDSGARDAIADRVSGYVVDPKDAQDVADKIDAVLNKKLIEKSACITWARQHDIKFKVDELINIYKGQK